MNPDFLTDFRIILRNGDGTVRKTHTRNKRRLVNFVRRDKWQNADLTVRYRNSGNIIGENRGVYGSWDEFLRALAAFIDPEVIQGNAAEVAARPEMVEGVAEVVE